MNSVYYLEIMDFFCSSVIMHHNRAKIHLKGDNMNKKTLFLYLSAFCFGILLLFVISITHKGTFYQTTLSAPVLPLTEWEVISFPEEKTIQLTQTLPENLIGIEWLGFFSIHQNIFVYLEDQLIYSYEAKPEDMPFGQTPGNIWNFIPILEEYSSCSIQIRLTSPYQESYRAVPDFYLGNKMDVLTALTADNLPTFIVAILTMFVGLFHMGYWIYMKRYHTNDTLFFLGLSSFSIAGWSLVELPITTLVLHNNIALAYAPYIFIIAMLFPFVCFIRNYYHNRRHKIWSVLAAVCLLEMFLCLFLQTANLLDFRHMLSAMLFLIVLFFLFICILTIRENHLYGLNAGMKLTVFCLILDSCGLLIDIARYYIYNGKSTFFYGNFLFLITIIILGLEIIHYSREKIQKSKKLIRLERLAYHDKLTDLYNRTAFIDYLSLVDIAKSGNFIFSIELHLNLTGFHQYNYSDYDKEILIASQILQDAFAGIGTCYRLGYMEFSSILQESTSAACEQAVQIIKAQCDAYNHTHSNSPILFFFGYAEFDSILDHDIDDVRSRADFLLCQDKVAYLQKVIHE